MQPEQLSSLKAAETEKYVQMWNVPEYRVHSPGLRIVETAYKEFGSPLDVTLQRVFTLTDFGVGSGKAANWFKNKGFQVTGIDIADNCLDPGIDINFHTGCLWDALPTGLGGDFGYCTDVLEHIPEKCVGKVLYNIMNLTRFRAFLTIAHFDDSMGRWGQSGDKLHLTVKPWSWWIDKINDMITKYRDSTGVQFVVKSHAPVEDSKSTSVLIERLKNG